MFCFVLFRASPNNRSPRSENKHTQVVIHTWSNNSLAPILSADLGYPRKNWSAFLRGKFDNKTSITQFCSLSIDFISELMHIQWIRLCLPYCSLEESRRGLFPFCPSYKLVHHLPLSIERVGREIVAFFSLIWRLKTPNLLS